MPAIGKQQRRTLLNSPVYIEVGNAAARSFADAVFQADDKSRTVEKINQTRGHNAHNPRMPFVGGENQRVSFFEFRIAADDFQYFIKYRFFHCLPAAVVGVELPRQHSGLFNIIRQQQGNRIQRRGDAPGGVYAWNQAERCFEGINYMAVNAAYFFERFDSRPLAFGN